jgi:hypothetical protein
VSWASSSASSPAGSAGSSVAAGDASAVVVSLWVGEGEGVAV